MWHANFTIDRVFKNTEHSLFQFKIDNQGKLIAKLTTSLQSQMEPISAIGSSRHSAVISAQVISKTRQR